MQEVDIPNFVDSQMQVFFWEVDEFIPSVVLIVVFIIMWNQPLFGIAASYVFTKIFSRFKNSNLEGVLFHISWWAGVFSMNKRFSTGLDREFSK